MLSRSVFLHGVIFDVLDCANYIVGRIEEDFPFSPRKTFGRSPVGFAKMPEWMESTGLQTLCGITFQLNDNLLGLEPVNANNQMNVIGHDGASPDLQTRTLGILNKTASDSLNLRFGEFNRRILKRMLGREAKQMIVIDMRYGTCLSSFGSRTETIEFPRANKVRP